jgi:hypothetical protein
MPRRAVLAFAFAVSLAASGCMGGGGRAYEPADLERMVVQDDDLPPVWRSFDVGRQVRADRPTGARSDPSRFGRLDGWKARYRRPGSPRTVGALVVESRADVFEDDEGARSDFDAYREELAASEAGVEEESGLGDEAIVATVLQGEVRFYTVVWRHRNAVASINLNGFDRRLTRGDAVDLARKQQARIETAAS